MHGFQRAGGQLHRRDQRARPDGDGAVWRRLSVGEEAEDCGQVRTEHPGPGEQRKRLAQCQPQWLTACVASHSMALSLSFSLFSLEDRQPSSI